jgi:hypothetical protein
MKNILALLVALIWAPPLFADDDIGVFETILESSLSFGETTAALEQAIDRSTLQLHGTHNVRLPDDRHAARLYVLTSPAYVDAASSESPRTASALVFRVAVFTSGPEQRTFVNMANPVAHAMVFFDGSPRYDALVAAAGRAADDLRGLVADIPGMAVSRQQEPMRSESHYNGYNGDGPARMMAGFKQWDESQRVLIEETAGRFEDVVDQVVTNLENDVVADASEPDGWQIISTIRLGDDAVYIGLTNPFIEDRMISINSRFRDEGKSDKSPYPGVDHIAALPTDVLVVREGGKTRVLHYGQMWRMQLYFWDSGYRAFTANMGVPGDIADSIEEAVLE